MGNLWRNVLYSLRSLAKSPGFTAVAVLSLALGIGTNGAVFSIIDAVLFRPYPYKDPERLAVVRLASSQLGADDVPLSYPDYFALRERARSFEGLAAISYDPMNVGQGETAVRVRGVQVSPNLFQLVGTQVLQGRTFVPEEDRPGGPRVVVVSEQFWRTRLGADANLLGRPLVIDGEPHNVIGIVAAESQLPAANDAAVFLPIARDPARESWEDFEYFVLGRLKPGTSLDAANTELAALSQQIAGEHPEERNGWTAQTLSLRESRTGDDRPMLLIGLACASFVLLIACVNVANLLLQRGAARYRDFAVRTALGASRGQILKQLLTESFLLALLGAASGVLLSVWLLRLTVRLLPAEDLPPYVDNYALNGRGLLYMLGVVVFTVLVFGLLPALKTSRVNLKESLSDGGQGSGTGVKRQQLRNTLVVVEVALSMILLVVCGLLLGSLFRMVNADTGIDRRQTLLVDVPLPASKYPEEFQRDALYRRALENARAIPGIGDVALADATPFGSWGGRRIELQGLAADEQKELPPIGVQTATEGYFEALGQTIVAGRGLTREDTRPDAPPVGVLNGRAAKRLFPDKDPLNQRIRLLDPENEGEGTWVTIVGVAEDIRRRSLADTTSVELYVPAGRFGWPDMVLLAHVEGDPLSLADSVRQAVQREDPTLAVVDARTLDRVISDSFSVQRVASILCGVFALFALLMAAIGMYGSLNYSVQQRTRELGIRMALGAQRGEVVSLVVRQVLRLVVIGLLIGLVGAFGLSKVMEGVLFGVGAGDLLTVLGVALILALVGLMASWLPARRASRVPPVITLRAS